jgi:hypothetical protein
MAIRKGTSVRSKRRIPLLGDEELPATRSELCPSRLKNKQTLGYPRTIQCDLCHQCWRDSVFYRNLEAKREI